MMLLQAIMWVRQSFIEKRRSMREHVHFPAWTETGDSSRRPECTVLDLSEGGARIMMSSPTGLPKEFWLVFSKDGTRRRRCRTVWRSGTEVGVIYLGPPQSCGLPIVLN